MPYDEEIPPMGDLARPSELLNELSYKVNGAAIEVHRHLGPGLPEEAYQRAMQIELALRQIPFESQKIVQIVYKGHVIGTTKIDLVVAGVLVVEIKSVAAILPTHRLQTRTYMRLIKQVLGLLINFDVPVLKVGINRIIDTEQN